MFSNAISIYRLLQPDAACVDFHSNAQQLGHVLEAPTHDQTVHSTADAMV